MPKTTKTAGEKKTRAPRTVKTPDAAKAALAAAEKKVELLKVQVYAVELNAQIEKSHIVAAFQSIKKSVKGISDIAILTAVAKAIGIKRVEVTQKAAVPRKAKAAK